MGVRTSGNDGDNSPPLLGGPVGSPPDAPPLNRLGGASQETLAAVVEVRRWQRQLLSVFEEVSDKNATVRFNLEGSLRDRKAAAETQLANAAADVDRIRNTSEQVLSKGLAGVKTVASELARLTSQLDFVRQELAAIDQV